MKKINIIQFLPYFPPHKGGLETHAAEWAKYWVQNGYWGVINVVPDIGQHTRAELVAGEKKREMEIIYAQEKIIGYKTQGYIVYLLPAFEIMPNFPVLKFWKKEIFDILRKLAIDVKRWGTPTIVQTRTRFFLTSFIGGIWAKYHRIPWVHIEHGSDYVLLGSTIKTYIAYIYDIIIGRIIFHWSDGIVAISEGVKYFIIKTFKINTPIEVIYRGIDFIPDNIKQKSNGIIKIGFVGRLVKLKGIDLLIQAFSLLIKEYPQIELSIVGDGDYRDYIARQITELWLGTNIILLWERSRLYIAEEFLPQIDILVNPSWQEWLPTTVIEWLLASCVVVATDVGGTREISDQDDLILVEKWNIESISLGLEKAIKNLEVYRWRSIASWMLQKFRWEINIEKYYKLYSKKINFCKF